MKRNIILVIVLFTGLTAFVNAQDKKEEVYKFTMKKEVPGSAVSSQQRAGTCWSYSSIGMIEAEMLRLGKEEVNLSEMFVVRKTYELKAQNYVRMHGNTNFGQGGALDHSFNVIRDHGAMPEEVYSGLNYGTDVHTHGEVDAVLKNYLDAVIQNKNKTLSTAWFKGYNAILDTYFGEVPESFDWKGKKYTPRTFADEVVGINPDDYYFFTSYTHHPFYKPFVIEVPDNFTWSLYNNIPVDEMMGLIENSINKGYAVVWAADVSEKGFKSGDGFAVIPGDDLAEMDNDERLKWEKMDASERAEMMYSFKEIVPEKKISQEDRQIAFDNYQTTDDHGMVLQGLAEDQNGNKYYYVKNSWGEYNELKGYYYASETYVRYKTMSFGVHKDVISKDLKKKFGIK